jgi:Uma2 family endonuclease
MFDIATDSSDTSIYTSNDGYETKPTLVKPLTWDEFQRKYLSREDIYKYEWVNGSVEKTKRNMEIFQIIVLTNLRRLFESLRISGKINGVLEPEIDVKFNGNVHRRPDVSYFSEDQLSDILDKKITIPEFVIEIISHNDQINRVHNKMKNYRASNVKVVWHIFPNLKEVHVYHGLGLYEMSVCVNEAICSASPVLDSFEIKAEDLFKLPV